MTVRLDYSDLHFDGDSKVIGASAGWMTNELFFADLIFWIGDQEFSFREYTSQRDTAAGIHGRLRRLEDDQTLSYENPILGGETVSFHRDRELVTVTAEFRPAKATVDRAQLLEAAAAFHVASPG